MKKIINTAGAPAAVGPYSQAIECAGTLYISGQLPIDPATGTMPAAVGEQTRICLENVGAILAAAGYDRRDVVKSTVLLDDMDNFGAMNEVYAEFYPEEMPARVCYQVARLPKNAKVEIETVAFKGPEQER